MTELNRFFEVYRQHGLDAVLIGSAYYADADKLHCWLLAKFWDFNPDSDYKIKIINADVDRISHNQQFPFEVRGDGAVVGQLGGSWDRMTKTFAQLPLYRSLEMRFIDGKQWDETPKFRKTKKAIKNGKRQWSCGSMTDLQKKCAYIDNLYFDIKENGYQSQLNDCWDRSVQGVSVPDEIRVAVGRDGRFIRCASGRHRLAIAKILGIDKIPAVVQIEHDNWEGEYDVIERIELH